MSQLRYPIFLAALLMAGCSSPPPPAPPAAREAALTWSQRGEAAYRRGDLDAARAGFEEALRVYTSLDDAEAMAGQSLNLGTVRYGLGDRRGARAAFEQVLAFGARVPAPLRAQAAYRVAVVEADSDNRAAAGEWLDKSLSLCVGAPCDVHGQMYNLRARLALAGGELASAEVEAKRALDYNRRRDDRSEQSNSLWLLAEVAMARGDPPQAESYYLQALTLDRALAEAGKIVRDLLGLARSVLAQGRHEAAMDFARRARSAAHSSGDVRATEEADRFLARQGGTRPTR